MSPRAYDHHVLKAGPCFFVLAIAAAMALPFDPGVVMSHEPLRVKALTFNVRYNNPNDGRNAWENRREMVRDVILGQRADFVGLQEAQPDQVAYLQESLTEYTLLVRSREADPSTGEAVPLGWRKDRWKLDADRHGTFWLSETPEEPGSKSWGSSLPRIVTWARLVEGRTGRAVYVYNAHFSHNSEHARRQSALLLARRIADRPTPDPAILLGDLNADASSPAVRHLTGQLPDAPLKLVDAFRAAHPRDRDLGTFHAFTGVEAGARIDYILAEPPVRVLDAQILYDHRPGRYPSDHFPVAAELEFDR